MHCTKYFSSPDEFVSCVKCCLRRSIEFIAIRVDSSGRENRFTLSRILNDIIASRDILTIAFGDENINLQVADKKKLSYYLSSLFSENAVSVN